MNSRGFFFADGFRIVLSTQIEFAMWMMITMPICAKR